MLLNVRQPEGWYDSVAESIYLPFKNRKPGAASPFEEMTEAVIWNRTFQGRFEDRAYAIPVFNRHYQEVREQVPAHCLLEFDVRQGWQPLCQFLGVPVPANQPLPRLNDRANFQDRRERGPTTSARPRR